MNHALPPVLIKRLVAFVLCAVILVLALPFAAQYAVIYGLKKAGAVEVVIGDVDLNLFTGEVEVSGLRIGNAEKPELSLSYVRVRIAYLPLIEKKIEVESIDINELRLQVREDAGRWHVGVPIFNSAVASDDVASGDSIPWGVGLKQLSLRDAVLDIAAKEVALNVTIESLDVADLQSWHPGKLSPVSLIGKINGAPIQITAKVKPFLTAPEMQTRIVIDALSLAPISPFLKYYIDSYDANLSVDADVRVVVRESGGIEIIQNGKVDLGITSLVGSDIKLVDSHVGWKGEVRVQLPLNEKPKIAASGEFSSRKLDVDIPGLSLGISHQGARWQGAIDVDTGDVAQSLKADGKIELSSLLVIDRQESMKPVMLKKMVVAGVSLRGADKLTVAQWNLKELQVLSTVLSIADVSLHSVEFSHWSDVSFQQLVIEGMTSNLVMLENARLEGVSTYIDSMRERLNGYRTGGGNEGIGEKPGEILGNAGEKPGATQEEKEASLALSFAELRFAGNNKINFIDRSVEPHYSETITIDELLVGALSTKQPNVQTPIDIKLHIGEFSTLTLGGALAPLQKKIEGGIELNSVGLELTKLSVYAEKSIGYAVGSGQFNLTSKLTLRNGKLRADNNLLVKQLELSPHDEALIASVSTQLTMPIGVSLDLLKDSDGNIQLSIPLDGDLDDPSVNLYSVVQHALVQALKKGALSYLKYAIQPYGAILLIGEQVGEMITMIRLDPVNFVAGSVNIAEAGDTVNRYQPYLPKLAAVLVDHPDLSIKICPVVVAADLLGNEKPKMNQRLAALASSRLAKIKQILIGEHQVAAERVLFCRATFGDGIPRVEMSL
ncbi:MAG: hypothetical protein COA99_03710 [Moraxellaceae bacterium]|nr:MAG: hypothetical protein COA99_03710 [Moraxellaceae bacterium]